MHKNLAGVLDSLEKAALPTVVVGARGSARIFAGTADVGGDTSVIRYAAHLTDAQLVWLYQRAGVLVFPSRYEGFGLPIVEAQSLGCPVIVSQAAGLPDVAGPGAILIDPDRPGDVPEVVRRAVAYTHLEVYKRQAGTYPEFADATVITSPLNRIAVLRRNHRLALPPVSYTHLDVYKRQT